MHGWWSWQLWSANVNTMFISLEELLTLDEHVSLLFWNLGANASVGGKCSLGKHYTIRKHFKKLPRIYYEIITLFY